MTLGMKLEQEFGFQEIARLSPGYVGADLFTLCKEASIIAVERIIKQREQDIEKDLEQLESNKVS
eukprot:CAMPEP_0170541384 /NCGR_PEP_ID=MMETSP0211-20121228/1126_1 /TAXON_ID=311385 /ORGANISM="Pseudokeronopsis sp., Strain OXSARD2" /LENGTH=64 /DNA_ID=CAMNT_0010844087 /DNA_START=1208 /DNA_END=1402 /DNA_ORIENTATION=+